MKPVDSPDARRPENMELVDISDFITIRREDYHQLLQLQEQVDTQVAYEIDARSAWSDHLARELRTVELIQLQLIVLAFCRPSKAVLLDGLEQPRGWDRILLDCLLNVKQCLLPLGIQPQPAAQESTIRTISEIARTRRGDQNIDKLFEFICSEPPLGSHPLLVNQCDGHRRRRPPGLSVSVMLGEHFVEARKERPEVALDVELIPDVRQNLRELDTPRADEAHYELCRVEYALTPEEINNNISHWIKAYNAWANRKRSR